MKSASPPPPRKQFQGPGLGNSRLMERREKRGGGGGITRADGPSPGTSGQTSRKPATSQPRWGGGRRLPWRLLDSGRRGEPAPSGPGGARTACLAPCLSLSLFWFCSSSQMMSVPVEKGDTSFPVALAKAMGRTLSVHLRRPDLPCAGCSSPGHRAPSGRSLVGLRSTEPHRPSEIFME